MPPGIGYGPELPSLDELFSALASEGRGPEAPPPVDLMLPPELNPIEPGPLHDAAQSLDTLGLVGRSLVPPPGSLPADPPPPEPLLDPYAEPAAQPTVNPAAPPRGSEAAIQATEAAELGTGQAAVSTQVGAERAESGALEQAAAAKLRAEQERERALLGDKSQAPGANPGVMRAGRERVEREVSKLRQLQDETYNTKINPDRLYDNMSTGQVIASAIGVFLGGLLIPTTGKNPAAEMLDRAVQRDIRAQEANLANLGESVGRQKGLLAQVRLQVGDAEAAVNMTAAISLRQAELKLEEQIAGIGDQKAQARGLDLLRQLEGRRAEYERLAYERASNAAWKDFQAELAMAKASAAGSGKKEEGPAPGTVSGNRIGGVESIDNPNGLGYVDTADFQVAERTKVRELVSTNQNSADLLADLKSLGTGRNLTKDKSKVLARSIMAKIRLGEQALIKGIPSDADQKIIDNAIAIEDPQAFLGWLSEGDRLEVLQYTADRAHRQTVSELYTFRLRPVPVKGRSLLDEPTTKQPSAPGKLSRGSSDPAAFEQDLSKADDLAEVQSIQRNHAAAMASVQEQLKNPLLAPAKEDELKATLADLRKVGGQIAKKLRQGEKAGAAGNDRGHVGVGESIEVAERQVKRAEANHKALPNAQTKRALENARRSLELLRAGIKAQN